MKPIKFVIFGDINKSPNTKDLQDEIKNRGFDCVVLDFENTIFDFSTERLLVKNGKINLIDFDIFLFRSITGFVREAKILMERLVFEGKVVVDEGVSRRIAEGKIFQSSKLQRTGINIPKTFQAHNFKSWKILLERMKFPIVVKPVKGRCGYGVTKIEMLKEALDFFERNPCGFLAQEFLKLDSDLRIFVVDNKILGGIKRHIIAGDFRTNCSLGARSEKIVVTKEMKQLALGAAKAVGYEVAGVDLVEYKGKLFVLEVNPSPQWQGFKETTGINPAKAIVELALEKYKGRNKV